MSEKMTNLIQHDGYSSWKWGGENCHLKKVVAFLPDADSIKWAGRENKFEPKNRPKNSSKSDFSRKWNLI